jgi:hypothetical protein
LIVISFVILLFCISWFHGVDLNYQLHCQSLWSLILDRKFGSQPRNALFGVFLYRYSDCLILQPRSPTICPNADSEILSSRGNWGLIWTAAQSSSILELICIGVVKQLKNQIPYLLECNAHFRPNYVAKIRVRIRFDGALNSTANLKNTADHAVVRPR